MGLVCFLVICEVVGQLQFVMLNLNSEPVNFNFVVRIGGSIWVWNFFKC